MNINGEPVYVGRDFGGRELVIDRERVGRYIAALGQRLPLYEEIAPALVLHSECYENLQWYLANIWGNLHARQEWELFAPLRVGDVVRSHSTVVERYRKRNRDYVVNEVLFTDADGRWLQRSRTHQSFLADDRRRETVVDREREKRGGRPQERAHCISRNVDGPSASPPAARNRNIRIGP